MKPESVLDLQMDTMRWWAQKDGLVFAQGFSLSMLAKQMEDVTPMLKVEARNMGERLRSSERAHLMDAQPFWVSPEFVDLTWKASESMEVQKLFPDDLPVPDGFMYLRTPLTMRDAFDREYTIRAIRWNGAVDGPLGQFYPGQKATSGVSIGIYSDSSDIEDEVVAFERGVPRPPLLLFGRQPWKFGTDYASDEHIEFENRYDIDEVQRERSLSETRRLFQFLQAMWTLMQQTIASDTSVQPSRAIRKRIKRSGLLDDSISEVRVITLRRLIDHPQEYDGESHPINWSHQWPVRGHWRWQWYPTPDSPNSRCQHCGNTGGQHRQIWIDTFVKGPPDKPFVDKIDIFKVSR